jgi:hypothetical protein
MRNHEPLLTVSAAWLVAGFMIGLAHGADHFPPIVTASLDASGAVLVVWGLYRLWQAR